MESKFVVIKQDGNKHEDWTYHCTNKDGIFSQMMIVTDNDVEISQYVSGWAATASIGERMHFREGVVEVVEKEESCSYIYDIYLDGKCVGNSGDEIFKTAEEAKADADDFIISCLEGWHNRLAKDFEVNIYTGSVFGE